MTLGGANVWSNFTFGSIIDFPKGCLLNPEGSRLIFFELFKKSPRNNIKIFTHIFYANHLGEPAGIKESSKMNLEDAWNKWHKLQLEGWTEVSHNFG